MHIFKEHKLNNFLTYFLLLIIIFFIYYISSPKNTPYNYFTRLADAFVNHRLYLTENPPWLNELIPITNRYYVVYPPMPAVLLTPFVSVFGQQFSQTIFSILLGSINPLILFNLLKRIRVSFKTSLITTIFFAFGTNYWFLASTGSAWYLAHIVAIFFLLLAIRETFSKQRLVLIGLLLGASYWSRSTVIFTLPFFLFYLKAKFLPIDNKSIYNLIKLGLGIGFFIFLDGVYNYLRFSDISPISPYINIPQSQRLETLGDKFMNVRNIPKHLDAIFLRLPHLQESFPYLIPSLYSLAIWFTSPAILLAFKAKKSILMFSSWFAIIPTFFVISLWTVTGYSQFGYRFAQDFMPFILILIALGIGQKPKLLAYLLVLLSVIINLWGIIMINFLNKWAM